MVRSILVIGILLAQSACHTQAGPDAPRRDIGIASSEPEAISRKHFGISVEALSILIVDGPVTLTHEQTIRLGDMGRRYRELEAAGHVTFKVPGSERAPRTGSGEPIHIVQTKSGRAIHLAFAP
jgi:hypothetical protein